MGLYKPDHCIITPYTSAKILTVEDIAIIALDLKRMLEAMGWMVPAYVASGEEAIEKAFEIHPDLVQMDFRLKSEINGIQVGEQIQHAFGIPVIYITAQTEKTILELVKVKEPFNYIGKPIREHELRASIEKVL